jgi:hypothetical protein
MKPIPHVPNINEFDGLLDIFSICNIMEASNILHHKTYLTGKSGLTVDQRLRMIHGRVKARQILAWIFANYGFEGDTSMETFYWRYLAHQLKTLFQIKERVEEQDIRSFNNDRIAKEVKKKIDKSFAGLSQFQNAWRDLPEDESLDDEVSDNGVFNGGIAEDEVPKVKPGNVRKLHWSLKERFRVIVRRAEPGNTINFGKYHPA